MCLHIRTHNTHSAFAYSHSHIHTYNIQSVFAFSHSQVDTPEGRCIRYIPAKIQGSTDARHLCTFSAGEGLSLKEWGSQLRICHCPSAVVPQVSPMWELCDSERPYSEGGAGLSPLESWRAQEGLTLDPCSESHNRAGLVTVVFHLGCSSGRYLSLKDQNQKCSTWVVIQGRKVSSQGC